LKLLVGSSVFRNATKSWTLSVVKGPSSIMGIQLEAHNV
jgi:hypothetical protein